MTTSDLLLEDPLARVHLNLIDLIHRAVGPFRLSYIKNDVVHTLGDLEDERLSRQRSMSLDSASFNSHLSPGPDAGSFSPLSCTPPNSIGHDLSQHDVELNASPNLHSDLRPELTPTMPSAMPSTMRPDMRSSLNGDHTLIGSSPSRRLNNEFDTDALIAYHLTKVEDAPYSSGTAVAKATTPSATVRSTGISEWASVTPSGPHETSPKNWGTAKPVQVPVQVENAVRAQNARAGTIAIETIRVENTTTIERAACGENIRLDPGSWPRVTSPAKKSMNNSELFEILMSRWNIPQTPANVKLIEGYGDLIWALPSDQLRAMTVNLCKRLFASRRRMFPYRKGVPPPQWPHGLRYTDPCHLLVRERVVLVVWILLDPSHNLAHFQDSIRELASDIPVDNIFCLIQYAYQVRMELFTSTVQTTS